MSASLRLGNQHVVTVEFTDLQVYPGAGVHRAALIARLNPGQGAAGVGVELLCQVYLAGPPRLWLGDARAERTATLNTFELREQLNFPLTDRQIAGIEEVVKGGDLQLDLQLRGRLIDSAGREHFECGGQTPMIVRREEWLRQLSQMRRASRFCVGVLAPDGSSGLAEVVSHLCDAERLYNTREYPSAVTAVRKALEIIRSLTPNMPTEKAIVNTGKPEDRSPAHRWAMLYHSALRLAHMGPHADPISASVTWRREDVQTLVALVNGIADQIAADIWPVFPAAATPRPPAQP